MREQLLLMTLPLLTKITANSFIVINSSKNNMHFFYKLIAPRADFHITMSENEQLVMGEHMQYWAGLFQTGAVAVYGPVFDPKGVFGMAVLEVETAEQAALVRDNDPAVLSGVCVAELFEMQAGMIRPLVKE